MLLRKSCRYVWISLASRLDLLRDAAFPDRSDLKCSLLLRSELRQLRWRAPKLQRAPLCLPARATILRKAMQEKSEDGLGVLRRRARQSSRTPPRRTVR